ncbi:alpha/beta hydrolase [uncultured Azonexus sp.]|uniref:alpha/beta fold hydrolase n=1 Tax=uncultured Azonexus sp. TaxID=520307 RepID=UPI00262DF9A4|nr:alpha/beta hydrolase [uncultured Azonexus sp.]
MKHILVAGLNLEYRDIPASAVDRPTLVMLHEGLGCVAMWRDFPDKLAATTGCRVLVYSRPGYGSSDPHPQPRQPDYMHREAREVLPAFLAALGIVRPVLVGHSDGGSIALIHAGSFPQAVAGLVVMAPHEFVEEETLAGIRTARKFWSSSDWPQRLARYHRDAQRVFHDWNDCWLSPEFRDWNIEDSLPAIGCPVLAIQGEDDEYATLRQIEVIAEKVPGTQLLCLANCGHSPQRDQEAAVLAAIAGFVG